MGDAVPVHCPECLRTQVYAAPVFPCACGSPVSAPVAPGAVAERITHRNWTDEWVTVRCAACGRENDWPQPELGCPCGTVLRVPVRPVRPRPAATERDGAAPRGGGSTDATAPAGGRTAASDSGAGGAAGTGGPADEGVFPVGGPADGGAFPVGGPVRATGTGSPWFDPGPKDTTGQHDGGGGPGNPAGRSGAGNGPARPPTFAERYPTDFTLPAAAPHPARPRGPFEPVTIRTSRDAVAAVAEYLRWLGFRDVVQPEERPASGVDLRAPGLVAQVDASTRPTGLRAVECLWLNGLTSVAASAFFSLAGYTPEARARASEIGLPLFALDLTGTPQPVNGPATELAAGPA
ncbi:hypothetical protein ACFW2Y_30560 [Streptomyces sp. NPDC058877]|uniref:hypothetical protein n=1 Tax=unclassified Streptomyces TaxID=2593676 RepID=UPI0036BDA5D7